MTNPTQSTNPVCRIDEELTSLGYKPRAPSGRSITRCCANCAFFNPVRPINQYVCGNHVSVDCSDGQYREPGPTDVCNFHATHQEDADKTAFLDANRTAILNSIKATIATDEMLDKLRKGRAQ